MRICVCVWVWGGGASMYVCVRPTLYSILEERVRFPHSSYFREAAEERTSHSTARRGGVWNILKRGNGNVSSETWNMYEVDKYKNMLTLQSVQWRKCKKLWNRNCEVQSVQESVQENEECTVWVKGRVQSKSMSMKTFIHISIPWIALDVEFENCAVCGFETIGEAGESRRSWSKGNVTSSHSIFLAK